MFVSRAVFELTRCCWVGRGIDVHMVRIAGMSTTEQEAGYRQIVCTQRLLTVVGERFQARQATINSAD